MHPPSIIPTTHQPTSIFKMKWRLMDDRLSSLDRARVSIAAMNMDIHDVCTVVINSGVKCVLLFIAGKQPFIQGGYHHIPQPYRRSGTWYGRLLTFPWRRFIQTHNDCLKQCDCILRACVCLCVCMCSTLFGLCDSSLIVLEQPQQRRL